MNVTSNTAVNFPQRYYNWDATTGALSSFAFAGQNALSMTYTAEQLRAGTTFPNTSGTRSESHTSLHGVIQSQFSAGNLQNNFYRGYEYDDIGRIKRVLANVQGSGLRWSYSYDNLGRLTGRLTEELCLNNGENPDFGLSTSCGSLITSEAFSYDQVGNRTDMGGVTGTGNRIQSFNGITFSHDADGNVTRKFRSGSEYRDYYWSAEARLDSAYHNSWSKVKYDYDAQGRLVRKWRGDPNGWTFDRLFLYDGDQLLVGLDQNMQRIDEYAYAPGIDKPIATIRGATGIDAVGYHVQDELGNIIGIVENGAYVSQTNSYDAWGTPTETGIAYNNRLRWKSLAWEGDVISLYYMRNRWYDYETGRFMSEDPVGLAGGINLYAFAGNDPIGGSDPYGLDCYGRVGTGAAICDPAVINTKPPRGPTKCESPDPWNCGTEPVFPGLDETRRRYPPEARVFAPRTPAKTWRGNSQCYASIGFASASLALDVVGGRAGATAFMFGGKAAVTYVRSWNPALVRQLGITFGTVEQRRLVNAAGGLAGAAAPDMVDNMSRWATQTGMSGNFNPLEILPWVGTINAGHRAFNACYR